MYQELGKLHLKKSKIKLLCSFCLILGSFYIAYTILYQKYKSHYDITTTYIQGKLLSYEIDGNTLKLEIKGKEKLIVFYTINSEKEKELYKNTLLLGNIYKFTGTLELPSSNTNFNLFSYRKYLLSKKIYYIMQAQSFKLYKKNNSIFYTIKNKLYKSIENKKTFSYLALFLFGNSDILDSDMLQMYRNCGISHLIAISGMHISLFSIILLYLLQWIPSRHLKYGIIITILWLYAFLINFTPSIMRAVMSFTITSIFNLLNKKTNPIYNLLCIGLIFLFYNPFYIYNTGFLFSFLISLFVILSSKLLTKYKHYISKVFMISLVAFLSGIPIIAISFYETNLLGLFLNIIFVPFISFIIFPGALITFIIPPLEPIFQIIINILEIIIQFCDKYFVIKLIVPHMNIYTIIWYYTILFLLLRHERLKYNILFFLFLFIHSYQNMFQKYPIITVIDVGQGDSILIQLPHNKGNILIDTGGEINYEIDKWKQKEKKSITERTILPYLKSIGIHNIDYLILSHGDYDHMGEAINLVNNFKVEKVIFNCRPYNDLEKELIKVLDEKKINYYSCIKELNIDNNKLYFLQTKEYDNENDNSNVIYTELNGYKFMFMGDAGVEKEKDILDKYNISDIDVLKVGHHGSKTSSSKGFIDEIDPKYSIISVGKNNRYGHPNKEVLNNLYNSKIYRTDQDGSIMFKIKNNKLKIETCSP